MTGTPTTIAPPHELSAVLPGRLAELAPTVCVLGDVILDEWLTGTAHRLCREAPAPVVDLADRVIAPGGAGNTAVNLAALGARVRLLAVVADDAPGRELRAALAAAGVATDALVTGAGATVVKRRVIADDHVLLRLDDGGVVRPPGSVVDVEALAGADAVVVCDYGLGLLDDAVRAAVCAARDRIGLLVVDAHDPGRWRDAHPDVVTPNAAEVAGLLGAAVSRTEPERQLAAHAGELCAATGAAAAVVTLDRDGAVLVHADGRVHRTWASPVPENHTAGAGDTFCAALTTALACGLPLPLAVELGQAAADVVVHRPGTAVCGSAQLADRLGGFQGTAVGREQLARSVADHRAAGRRIVFTNGCFDQLHSGHVGYLNQAKRQGDVLVVALNSDAGVTRLKGPGRPVHPVADRAAVIAALSCVDAVTVFDEDTPADLLRLLRPDIYVKGGDYTAAMLAETEVVHGYGGEVRIVDYVPDRSQV